jgi:hypothetical protein
MNDFYPNVDRAILRRCDVSLRVGHPTNTHDGDVVHSIPVSLRVNSLSGLIEAEANGKKKKKNNQQQQTTIVSLLCDDDAHQLTIFHWKVKRPSVVMMYIPRLGSN